MKKLLALVLCVMLFVSVIPTSAFATSSSISGSAIDLSPAYAARNTLYAAFGVLGEAHMYKNAILGIRAYETKDTKTLFEEGPIAKLQTALKGLENVKLSERTGMSYYGLAKIVAPIVVEAHNMAGNVIVGLTAAKIGSTDDTFGTINTETGYTKGSLVDGALTQVNNIIASIVPASSGEQIVPDQPGGGGTSEPEPTQAPPLP